MLIRAISDTHGYLPKIEPCDLLLHAGDWSPLAHDRDLHKTREWFTTTFTDWLDEVPADRIVGIAGNHDFLAERGTLPNAPWTYLQDHSCTINGVKIYGFPYVPNLIGWAFSGAGDSACVEPSTRIPDDVDILLSHGPPAGFGDHISWAGHVGSTSLYRAMERVNPKYLVCGHIHEGHGVTSMDNITIVNCSLNDENYNLVEDEAVNKVKASMGMPTEATAPIREPYTFEL